MREIFVSLGFEVDRNSENVANQNIQSLRETADSLLSNMAIGFESSEMEGAIEGLESIRDSIEEATSGTRSLTTAQTELTDTVDSLRESYDDVDETMESLVARDGEVQEVIDRTEEWAEANEEVVDTLEDAIRSYEELLQEIPEEIPIEVPLEPQVDPNPVEIPVEPNPDPLDVSTEPQVSSESESKFLSSLQSLKTLATAVIGIVSVVVSLANMNEIVEEFSGIRSQIKSAVGDMTDLADAQSTILASSNSVRMSYESTASAISDLVSSSPDMFETVEQAAAYNETCVKLFKSAGKSNEEVESLVEAIGVSYKKGAVDSGTISTLLEQSPEAVELLNKKLGTTTDQLETLAGEGGISLQDLTDAFMDSADSIDEAFGDVRFNISDALLNIRNQWGFWLSDMDETYGITEAIGTTMVKVFSAGMEVLDGIISVVANVVDNFGGIENVLKLIGIIATAVLGNLMIPKIMAVVSAIMSMDKALLLAKAKMVAMIAVVVLIALLIEDFINFMMGNDSLIGALFEKAGIDAETARQTIITAWTAVKTFLVGVWEFLASLVQTVSSTIADWWIENGERVATALTQIWTALLTVLQVIFTGLFLIIKTIFTAIQMFWSEWGDEILGIFATVFNMLVSLITPLLDALAAVIVFIASVFTGDWESAWNAVKDLFAAIIEIIIVLFSSGLNLLVQTLTTFISIVSTLLDALLQLFIVIFTAIGDFVISALEFLLNGVVSVIGTISDAIVDGLTVAIDWIKSLPSEAVTWGKDIILGIVEGIQGAMSAVTDAVSSVASNIKSVLGFSVPEKGPLSNFDTYMPDMIDLMVEGIEGTKSKVIHSVEDLASNISDSVTDDIEMPSVSGPSFDSQPTISIPDVSYNATPNYPEEIETTHKLETEQNDPQDEKKNSSILDHLSAIKDVFESVGENFQQTGEYLALILKQTLHSAPDNSSDENQDDKQVGDSEGTPTHGNEPTTDVEKPTPPDYSPPPDSTEEDDDSSLTVVSVLQTVADTLQRNSTKISTALEQFLKISETAQSATVASPETIIKSEGNGSGSVSINQNVNINNEFHGDVAGQQQSAKAMEKATEDTTSELARAFQYAK